MKKFFLVLLILTLTISGVAWIGNCPNLPIDPVIPTVTKYGTVSYFDIQFSDIAGIYDVANGVKYAGWCIDPYGDVASPDISFYLMCSVGAGYGAIPWDKINYLLNHKIVSDPVTFQEKLEIQYAIWYLVTGGIEPWSGFTSSEYWSGNAQAMYNDANTNGAGFIPQPGDTVAVIMVPATEGFYFGGTQEMIIELTVPPYQYEGCTPGYWKNHTEMWPSSYNPSDSFSNIFGVVLQKDYTLIGALNLGGGANFAKILRHGTAALLSAAHPDVHYPYTEEQVIQIVKDALGGNKYAIEALVAANEYDCPIGR